MTTPTWAQAKSLASGGGLPQDTIYERMVSLLASLASGQNPDGTTFSLPISPQNNGIVNLPTNQVVSAANQAATANAAAVATLPNAAGLVTFISGIVYSAGAAAAAVGDTIVIAGLKGGNSTLSLSIPTGGIPPTALSFPQPIPASAVNTAITVTFGASGAAGPAISVLAYGFQQ